MSRRLKLPQDWQWDLCCAAGFGLLLWGVHEIYPPAAMILAGAVGMFIGIRRATK